MKIKTLKPWWITTYILLTLLFSDLHADQHQLANGLTICHTAEPSRLRESFENAIENAQRSILILTFTFSDREFIELLNKKAESGVDVVIVINKDHRGSLRMYGSKKLQIFTRFEGEGRVHHKILVVDDRDVWLGSANFSTAAFTSQENLVVGVRSPDIAAVLRQEAEVYQYDQLRSYPFPIMDHVGSQEVELCLLPHSNPSVRGVERSINEAGKKRLLTLIKEAKRGAFVSE